jgi:hypothetical protein
MTHLAALASFATISPWYESRSMRAAMNAVFQGAPVMRTRLFRSLATLALVLATATVSRASTLGLDVTSDTQIFAPGVFHNIGWQFSVSAPITIDGLGLFDVNPAGLSEEHQVGLWDNSGNLLASTTVTSGSTLVASASGAGDWLFANIAPIVLVPGTYVTGGFFATSADSVMANATITTVPQISFLASRASTEGAFAEPGVYGLVEPGVFAANIRVSEAPAAVPEPASMFLLGSGLATLAIRRRRSTK